MSIKEELIQKDYLPTLKMNDGTPVTRESWGKRRGEMLALLEEYSYGKTPDVKAEVKATDIHTERYDCAGKARHERLTLVYKTVHGEGSFPIQIFTPLSVERPPVFLHIGFSLAPHWYIPVEEIIDAGYALVVVDYRDMVNDNHYGDFSGGIAAHFGVTKEREKDEWGKIGMWAWGTSRIMDYLIAERDDLDTEKVALIGHSRLGKTALWCGAQDERFAAVISNNSGYGGASSSKHGEGERITDFIRLGSYDWFCPTFTSFKDSEDEKPYDQSFLLSLIAPRYLLVGSAELDKGADPKSEFLTTCHASAAWELLGEKGLVAPDGMPSPDAFLGEGNILYHYRTGKHCLSRDDWAAYIKFLDSKFK
ncbi:MAG: acetylxylan esterase [Clostridia bacterium]|nr:acetylxylan esterase [Clostridia bacterium]